MDPAKAAVSMRLLARKRQRLKQSSIIWRLVQSGAGGVFHWVMKSYAGFFGRFLGVVAVIGAMASGRLAAEETVHSVLTASSSTTLSGFVDTSAQWNLAATTPEIPEPSSLALFGMSGLAIYFGRRVLHRRRGISK